MSRQQIATFFTVSRTPKTVSKQKRVVEDSSLEIPVAKKAAFVRFAHLSEKSEAVSSLEKSTVTGESDTTIVSTRCLVTPKPSKSRPTKVRPKTSKLFDLSKQSTINWSPLPRESPTVFTAKTEERFTEPQNVTVSNHITSPVAKQPINKVSPKQSRTLPTISKTLRSRRKVAIENEIQAIQDENQIVTPPLTPTSPHKGIPAFERFAHLIEPIKPQISEPTIPPISASTETELTQIEEKIPSGLPLPFDYRVLFDLFRSCDTIVSMLHNRQELCGFDKLKPAVQEVVRRNFEESHVGQFMSVYPRVYNLRYEKQMDKFTRRPTGGYVLVLSPNLRNDGTQMGHDSPSKGHLVFTGTRLIQRRNRFHRLLIAIVMQAHRQFLATLPGVNASDLPEDSELRRWHPKFTLDTMVPPIKPSPLPIKPSDTEQKITTAKDAVRAFQARALFREAEACQNVTTSRLQNNSLPSIPSPTKASACSPRKLFTSPDSCSSVVTQGSMPSVALFSSPSPATSGTPMSVHLKGVSESLLAKVRAKENERRLLTQLTQSSIPESRRVIYARLPSLLPQIWTVMRTSNGRPMPMTTVASRIAGGHHSGLCTASIIDHLNVVLELCPFWIEKLSWATPHLKIRAPGCSVKEILDSVKEKLAKEGYQL